MSVMCKILDWDWLETYQEDVHRLGMPRCAECGKKLRIGDKVDGNWPWFDDFNLCCRCEAVKEATG